MIQKKRHLDLDAVRDLTLGPYEKGKVERWISNTDKGICCPITDCKTCQQMSPEIIGYCSDDNEPNCPCHVLYVKDIIKIAMEAVR